MGAMVINLRKITDDYRSALAVGDFKTCKRLAREYDEINGKAEMKIYGIKKPHIKQMRSKAKNYFPHWDEWSCCQGMYCGFGATPEAAYQALAKTKAQAMGISVAGYAA